MLEEGGYYAIKGFSFQYIVSLIEVFNSVDYNKKFSFENIQDFNDDEVIYQMKYKETQHYTNCKIKEPTIKIFEQFKTLKKDYVLYTYFNDKSDEVLTFSSVEELDKVLLNCKIDKKEYTFTLEEKEEFISHYKVVFSQNYINKSEELVGKIKQDLSVSIDVAEMYYYSLVTYIINLIVKNKPQDRFCTKKLLIEYLKDTSSKIFYDFSLKYSKKEKYLKFIRNEYFFEKNINDHNRVFIINLSSNLADDYYDCVCKIIKRYYVLNKKRNMIKSHAPYIYLANIDDCLLVQLKCKLVDYYNITDGYRFKGSELDVDFITKKFTPNDNVSCKLINSIEDLVKIITKLKNSGVKVYEFYDDENRNKCELESIVSIQVENIDDICKILK